MTLRDTQKVKMLRLLRRVGPLTRPDIGVRFNLTPPAVSGLVKELIKAGVAQETGFEKSGGGRRAARIGVNPTHAMAAGLEISLSHGVRAVVSNLGGDVVATETLDRVETDGLMDASMDVLGRLLSQSHPCPISGIGVAISGLVDAARGISREFPRATSWHDVPIKEMLETRFGGLSVCVENDVHCAALAALRYGVGRSLTHFVYVHVGHGIAAGIIIGGEVYTGATGNAGEFGHIPVEKDGPICYCGSRGCLESVAGAPAIVDSVRSALAKGVHSSLVGGEVTLANILLAADGGDRLAATVLERAAGYIGDAVGGLVNLLNPQAVVLGGLLAMPGGVFLSTLEKSLLSRVMPLLQDSVVIRASELGSDAAALGAAGLVFERMFDNPSILLTRLASGASSPS